MPDDTLEDTTGGLFRPVVGTRMSATIVDQIRALIRSGQLPVGARLPAERDLCTRFGVSRLTVREALRMLEANGLVSIRLGREGGAFVSVPTTGQVGQGITDLLTSAAVSSADVTDARRVLELGFLPQVCERATEADVDHLRALCDHAERARVSGGYDVEMSFEFHRQLIAATHNPAAVMLVDAFRDPILRSLSEAHHVGTSGVEEHRLIVEAVAQRDADLAVSLMSHHLDRTVERLQHGD
ncbi:MAG: transcriptional regulator, GntR family [Nocardioides sp.]|nr:transcriptional regulator, GntR family [Nocardioides sp.]